MGQADTPSCSFCGRAQDQVRKLVAGPGVHVCDECIAFGTEFLAGAGDPDDAERGEPVACSFCGTQTGAADVVASPAGVCVCKACVDRGQRTIDEELGGSSDAPD